MRTRFGYNSTIARREKICVSCGKPCYPFSKGRCQPCSTIETTQKRIEAVTEEMIKDEDLSDIIKDLDAVFSRYIRLKYADSNGIVTCFTSGQKKHWTLMQNGHFIPRSHLYLRWDERNCRPQTPSENELNSGNMKEYRKRLNDQHPGLPDILDEERNIIFKPTKSELKQLISEYSVKAKELLKKIKK